MFGRTRIAYGLEDSSGKTVFLCELEPDVELELKLVAEADSEPVGDRISASSSSKWEELTT